MANKKVCIIIVLFNSKQYLDDCFFSLKNINYPKEFYEILVVDNASTDDSVAYLKKEFPDLEIIENKENSGFAKGNNIGMKSALEKGFDYIYLLNADTEVTPDFLSKAVGQAESDEKIGSVQSRMMLWNNKELVNSIGNEIHYLGFGFCRGYKEKFDQNNYKKEIAYASGAGVLLKTKVLKKTGLFEDDFFMYHEDLDLGWKNMLCGYKNILAKDSIIFHKYSFSKSIKKYYFMERNRFLVLFQNYKLLTLLVIFPPLLIMELGLFCFSLKTGFWREKLKVYKYFLSLKNWSKIKEKRKFIKSIRQVKDKDILKLFTGRISYQEEEMQSFVLEKIANPVFNACFWLIKKIIFW